MADDRYDTPRDRYGRNDQDFGQDYGSREYGYSSARDYQAAGQLGGDRDRDRQGDPRRGDEREPPGADAQGCDSREHDGTGGVIGAADHHDPPACVLGAPGRGERPLAQHPVVDPGRLTPA